jgi:hypothetical protein
VDVTNPEERERVSFDAIENFAKKTLDELRFLTETAKYPLRPEQISWLRTYLDNARQQLDSTFGPVAEALSAVGRPRLAQRLSEIRRDVEQSALTYKDMYDSSLEHQRRMRGLIIQDAISTLSKADPDNVQEIAASQFQLLTVYHETALDQSRKSFFLSVVGAGLGLMFFMAAAGIALLTRNTTVALIPVISGAVVEVIAGIVFFLYGKTTAQLSEFHGRLETLQRYVLANSMCGGLDGDERNKARAALIREMAKNTMPEHGLLDR